MEIISFDEFLLLNEKEFNDFQKAFYFIKNYIEEFKNKKFEFQNIVDLRGLVDKFLQFGEPIADDIKYPAQKLTSNLEKLESHSHKFKTDGVIETTIQKTYQEFYSSLLLVYNKISLFLRNNTTVEDYLDFDGLFSYDTSNKHLAIKHIENAIELIKNDNSISDKSKEKIIKYLTETISELLNPKSNWSKIYSKVTEAMIVLGTLGSVVSGISAGNNLLSAKDKLEEAKDTIVQTSINMNYFNIQQTFNIQENIAIENNKLILPESDGQTTHNTQ